MFCDIKCEIRALRALTGGFAPGGVGVSPQRPPKARAQWPEWPWPVAHKGNTYTLWAIHWRGLFWFTPTPTPTPNHFS